MDAQSGANTVWARVAASGAGTSARCLSTVAEEADWPSAAFAGDGSVVMVGWTDNAAHAAKASDYSAGA